jgi:hypothetical protein
MIDDHDKRVMDEYYDARSEVAVVVIVSGGCSRTSKHRPRMTTADDKASADENVRRKRWKHFAVLR